ncbi:MAG: thioester reductase domain-containing protein [Oculatellaceae cyanobacterium Prado106]|jgi:thioester reductase-like protein|nr:thioester reductase domain-containing protein [Oculatellaceae cyanobacterium Prado106]
MTTTQDLSQRIAGLSPQQRELLLQQLKQKAGLTYRSASATEKNPADSLDLAKEAELDPSIQPMAVPGQFCTRPKTVFLTGGTGFLGAFIIAELMKQTSAAIYCLVRAKSSEDGKARIQKNLQSYGIWQADFGDRIIPVLGDLASPQFSLSAAEFHQLACDIDVIYHCAASLNFVFPYTALKAMNVTATEDVIRLASQVRRKTVHYMSSVSVFESHAYAGKTVDETDLLDHHDGMFLGYAQTKWVAEKLMLAARSRGLPVCIYRLPFISGDSNTGAWNTEDFTCLAIKGCMIMGAAPLLDYWVYNCPVNYASEAIAFLAQQPQSAGKVFHLMNPYPATSEQVNAWDRAIDSPVKYLPYQEWQAQLARDVTTPDHPLFSLRSFFLEPFTDEQLSIPELYTRDRTPVFDCTATLDALRGSGIHCQPISPALSATYFDYFLRQGMLSADDFGQEAIAKFRFFFRLQRLAQKLSLKRAIVTLRDGFDFVAWKRINLANFTS